MQLVLNKCEAKKIDEEIGIIFDMDGVIIDTCTLHEKSWFGISSLYGFPWNSYINFKKEIFGTSSINSAKLLFGNSLKDHDLNVMCKKKDHLYKELLYENINQLVIPGFSSFFNKILNEKIPVALATSAGAAEAEYVLKHIGIWHEFKAIFDISMVKKPKPHPEIYLKTCNALGIPADKCIGFEDSLTGIRALQDAGIRCVVVGSSITEIGLEFHRLNYELYIKDYNQLTLDELLKKFTN